MGKIQLSEVAIKAAQKAMLERYRAWKFFIGLPAKGKPQARERKWQQD